VTTVHVTEMSKVKERCNSFSSPLTMHTLRKATLADMGITKDQSTGWQARASMLDEHLENSVTVATDRG
jgi:hypothetical protein